jgi:hypothetical protein
VDLIVGLSKRHDLHELPDRAEVRESLDLADLDALKAESLGWLPLDAGAYLHVSDEAAAEVIITGVPQAGAAVLLLV